LGSRPEDQPERVNQVDADLTRPVAFELVRPAEHHVGKRLDGLKFLKTLAEPLGAGRAIGPVERCLAVAQPDQPVGLEGDLQLPLLIYRIGKGTMWYSSTREPDTWLAPRMGFQHGSGSTS